MHINQKKLREYYKISNLLVITSFYETWGLTINEAFASNLPVICSENWITGLTLIIASH